MNKGIITVAVIVTVLGGTLVGYNNHSKKQAAKELARLEQERMKADRDRVALAEEAERVKAEADAEKRRQEAAERAPASRYRETQRFDYRGYSAASEGSALRATEREIAAAAMATEYQRQQEERRRQYEDDMALRRARAEAERQARWVRQQEMEEERARRERAYRGGNYR